MIGVTSQAINFINTRIDQPFSFCKCSSLGMATA